MSGLFLLLSVIVELIIPGSATFKDKAIVEVAAGGTKLNLAAVKPAPLPVSAGGQRTMFAESGIVFDIDSGTTLLKKDVNKKQPIASITKLMTALLIVKSHKLGEVVTVPSFRLTTLETKMGLKPGDKVRVGELLHGLLVPSGSDAAYSLAIYHSGSVEKFVDDMNKTAKSLGMANTVFKNPTGIDLDGAYSTAVDVLTLGRIALTDPTISKIVKKRRYTAVSESGKKYPLFTTNNILDGKYVIGIKTGFTAIAGQCLLSLAERGGHRVVSVVLNSPDRFGESLGHLDWAFNNFKW